MTSSATPPGTQGPAGSARTCATVLAGLVGAIEATGHDWRALLRAAGIDPAVAGDPEAFVDLDTFERFWQVAAEKTDDPLFSIHVAENVKPRAVNIIGYLLMSSATVGKGLERVSRFQRVSFGDQFFELERGTPTSRILLNRGGATAALEVGRIEYTAVVVLKFLDWITEADFRATEVRFMHSARGPVETYERALRSPVKFERSENALVIPSTSLDKPSMHANPDMAQLHEEYAERILSEHDDQSVSARVRAVIAAQLELGAPSLDDVARSLHMSARTLQRRLTQEGTSFQDLLDNLRQYVCLHHLARTHSSLGEISYLAGFSDSSAFSRAVRRWTGKAPGEYRSENRSPAY